MIKLTQKLQSSPWIQQILCAFLLLTVSAAQAEKVLLDRIVAVVDEDVVLQSQLDSRIRDIQDRARGDLPPIDELRTQLLDTLIIESLQLQMADRNSIRVDDDTVNRALGNLAEQSGMTFDDYVAALQADSRYLTIREELRNQFKLREIQYGVVNSRIHITDQEIENYLNSEEGQISLAPEFEVEQILIPVAEDEDEDLVVAKRAFAEDLFKKVQLGADFRQTQMDAQRNAAANTPGAYVVSGANLGFRKENDLPSPYVALVLNMKAGEVHQPVQLPNGFHIIKVVEIRGGTTQLVDQTHIRHLMIVPNEIRTEEQAKALIGRLRQRIVDGANFASVARQNSDDASSVVAGGDLDWVSDGGMPADFEEIVKTLEVDKLSEPFRTEMGWHIAEVLGYRIEDLSSEYSRRIAERSIRDRMFDLELENWLIELREKAFVDIKEFGNP